MPAGACALVRRWRSRTCPSQHGTAPELEARASAAPVRAALLGRHDGAARPSSDAPTFTFRSPTRWRTSLRAPGELGLGRAYVAGLLEVDDLDGALRMVDTFEPPPLSRGAQVPARVAR